MFRTQNINALFLSLAPILSVYNFENGVLLYYYLIVALVIFNILSGNFFYALKVRRNEVQWYGIISVIGIIGFCFNSGSSYFNTSLFVNNYISLSLFFMALMLCVSDCNLVLFKRTLVLFGVIAAVICVGQRVQLQLTGSFYKDFFIPGLEVKRDLESFSVNRVSAFFTEPAHLSIYLIPIYYILLRDGNLLLSTLLAVGVLFSGSTTGLILVFWLTFIYIMRITKKKIYVVYSMFGIVLLCMVIMYLFPSVLIDNIKKLTYTDINGVRMLGPLYYLESYDIDQWCFGIGLNQLSNYLQSHGLYVVNDWGMEKNANYANAVIYMLLSYGILGLCFFLRYLKNTIKCSNSDWGFIIYALGILLSDQVLFNMNLFYVLSFIILSQSLLNNEDIVSDSPVVL